MPDRIPPTRRPTRAEVEAAEGLTVRGVLAPGLRVLFCGINPGLYTAAVGHHFGRPGNRFWPTLHRAGFTPRLFSPYEERELLALGYGITNLVARATATADQLRPEELVAGGKLVRARVARYRPRCLAVLGVTAYRVAFGRPKAALGPQPERLSGALVWVLPNPSGLNAHYDLPKLAALFRAMAEAVAGER
ncbi:MAG: G/U mismatch-specific DNA glycosylase [Anaerolineales bacterium]|nr:G/U mismatch-specific DNA glycosylase [Anaerolineales bacterium]